MPSNALLLWKFIDRWHWFMWQRNFWILPPTVPLFPACCFSMTSQIYWLNAQCVKPCSLVDRDQHFGWIQCLFISHLKWQSYIHTTKSTSPTGLYNVDVRRRLSRWTLKIRYLSTPRCVDPCHHMARHRVANGGRASNMEGSCKCI